MTMLIWTTGKERRIAVVPSDQKIKGSMGSPG